MSASGSGTMRGSWETTRLLLVLLLLTTFTGTVFSESGIDHVDSQTDSLYVEPSIQELTPDDVVSAKAQTLSDAISTSDTPPTDGIIDEEKNKNIYAVLEDLTISPWSESDLRGLMNESTAGDVMTTLAPLEEGLKPIIILIPVVLVVVIIAMIVCGLVITRRWSKKAKTPDNQNEDPFLEESSSEKVPMPMFEEDVPSVLELEMDQLDDWMKKDGEITLEVKQT